MIAVVVGMFSALPILAKWPARASIGAACARIGLALLASLASITLAALNGISLWLGMLMGIFAAVLLADQIEDAIGRGAIRATGVLSFFLLSMQSLVHAGKHQATMPEIGVVGMGVMAASLILATYKGNGQHYPVVIRAQMAICAVAVASTVGVHLAESAAQTWGARSIYDGAADPLTTLAALSAPFAVLSRALKDYASKHLD